MHPNQIRAEYMDWEEFIEVLMELRTVYDIEVFEMWYTYPTESRNDEEGVIQDEATFWRVLSLLNWCYERSGAAVLELKLKRTGG